MTAAANDATWQDADDLLVGAQIQMTAAVSGVVPDDTFTVSHAVNALGFGRFQIVLRQAACSTHLGVHWSPLVRSAFCPKKVDLTSMLTLHPGYNSA